MKIEYHKPTIEDRRRQAGFWLALGSFTSSIVSTQLFIIGLAILIIIVLYLKLIIAIIGGVCD